MREEISQREYWNEVESLAKQVTEEARERNEEISEVLHETIDGHQWVIYTYYNYQVLQHSPNDAYSIENFGVESATQDGTLNTAALAFGALYGDVSEHSAFDAEPEEEEDDGTLNTAALAFGALYGDVSEHSAFDAEPEEEEDDAAASSMNRWRSC